MIGYVRGIVTHLFKESCYVDVHGVGYRVYVPTTTRQQLNEGHEATLFTYLNVREDAMQLKDKLAKMTHISADSPAAIQPIGVSASGATGEAIEALVSLGYSERDVADIVESLDDGKRDVSELIKVSLIELGKGR